jgi:hypothetical protein
LLLVLLKYFLQLLWLQLPAALQTTGVAAQTAASQCRALSEAQWRGQQLKTTQSGNQAVKVRSLLLLKLQNPYAMAL